MNNEDNRRREAEQREAQRAVQRSLDRRDRGGDAGQPTTTARPVAR